MRRTASRPTRKPPKQPDAPHVLEEARLHVVELAPSRRCRRCRRRGREGPRLPLGAIEQRDHVLLLRRVGRDRGRAAAAPCGSCSPASRPSPPSVPRRRRAAPRARAACRARRRARPRVRRRRRSRCLGRVAHTGSPRSFCPACAPSQANAIGATLQRYCFTTPCSTRQAACCWRSGSRVLDRASRGAFAARLEEARQGSFVRSQIDRP